MKKGIIGKLLQAHDLIMEMGFKGTLPMAEAEKQQIKIQRQIMDLRAQGVKI
tara:strand:- start:1874 stop:2029 length:156 start_codon:yes stop_codon:yes gene_type:complete